MKMNLKKLKKLSKVVACSSMLCLSACGGLVGSKTTQAKAETFNDIIYYSSVNYNGNSIQRINSIVLNTYLVCNFNVSYVCQLDFSKGELKIVGCESDFEFYMYDSNDTKHSLNGGFYDDSNSAILYSKNGSYNLNFYRVNIEFSYINELVGALSNPSNYHFYTAIESNTTQLYSSGFSLSDYYDDNTMPSTIFMEQDFYTYNNYSTSPFQDLVKLFNFQSDVLNNPSTYGLYTYDDLVRNGERNYEDGYNVGFDEGSTANFENSALRNLFNSVLVSPFYILWNGFNFEIFGVNFRFIVSFILTIGVCLLIWQIAKRFMK